MAFDQVVVWVDRAHAYVRRFDRERVRAEVIRTCASEMSNDAQLRDRRQPSGTERYFSDIAEVLKDARAILIVGPGFERLDLLTYLRRHAPEVAQRIVALEPVDHPSEEEMVPWARKHFAGGEVMSH